MDLQQLRKNIDAIDENLVRLFERRMEIAAEVAAYKQQNSLPIYDSAREREKLYDLSQKVEPGHESYVTALYSLLFELSRSEQERIINPVSVLADRIGEAVQDTDQVFPERAVVACQGVEGAYAQLATEKLFSLPSIIYCNTFESVFSAIDSGLCAYGVLPLENSTAGSINQVYDLMMRYPFFIVRSARLKIDHCLLAKENVEISSIKEVYSHEQAIAQCTEFLKSLGCKVTACENTAEAAKMVAESERSDVAALSSRNCAALYGLKRLEDSVQDQGNNYTRFICISKSLAIYPGADKTSLMLTLPHRPGSLYQVLSRFYIHGINLIKLESRPLPDRDFEFMFYFDLEAPVHSPAFSQVLRELKDICDDFYYLGSYSEVV
ncbi:MAG: bifunctional chorismate mutase/prephenate dehydratase [Clostridiales bacterium]|nr:bifunctional chorismate mutase/prephenate dehydratase [Clostridiales bacterium]